MKLQAYTVRVRKNGPWHLTQGKYPLCGAINGRRNAGYNFRYSTRSCTCKRCGKVRVQ